MTESDWEAFREAVGFVVSEQEVSNQLLRRQVEALELLGERLETCNERTNERLQIIARCLGALERK